MRENLGETENEVVEYENLRTEEALRMLRNNEVAMVEAAAAVSSLVCAVSSGIGSGGLWFGCKCGPVSTA